MNTHAIIRTKLISECVCIIVHAYLFMQDLSRFGSPVWITNHVQKFQSSFVIVPLNQSCTPSPVAHQYVLLRKHYLNSSFKLYFYTLTHDEHSVFLYQVALHTGTLQCFLWRWFSEESSVLFPKGGGRSWKQGFGGGRICLSVCAQTFRGSGV